MRGQSLVELAICLPVALALALGTVAIVQLEDAQSGLDAATAAAAATAARAPDENAAMTSAQARFAAVIASYPVRSPSVSIVINSFLRGASVQVSASGSVDLGWACLPGLPRSTLLHSAASEPLESWRSHW